MSTYKTNISNPPPFTFCAYVERSCDPFAPGMINEALGGPTPDKKETGWLLIDWIENAVGFVADGTECPLADKPDTMIKTGYFKDGRLFAYNVKSKETPGLLKRHAELKEQENKK
jgi:hypothetical protein